MRQWSTKKKVLALVGLSLCTWVAATMSWSHFYPAHQHCSKALAAALMRYAQDHQGRYPSHTNGFGDALLLLVKTGDADVSLLVAPGDDGRIYNEFLTNGQNVPEENCTRIYIQGLTDSLQCDVAMMFDKRPTRGGDHFRSPWGTPMRDVVMSSGLVKFIPEKRWPIFASEQIEELVKLDLNRAELERLFGIKSEGIPR